MHSGLSLRQRCEAALAGFLLQDLWAMLASRRESKMRCQKGSFQIASQTRNNLQLIALTAVCISVGKDDAWSPFQHGCSLSEISIERMFGRLRSTSASGDLHCRTYWSAAAAAARFDLTKAQSLTKKFGLRGDVTLEPKLTEQELLGLVWCWSPGLVVPLCYILFPRRSIIPLCSSVFLSVSC